MNDSKQNKPDSGRDSNGRFTTGNPGGPGNPFNRELAALRKALIAAVTEGDVQDVIRQVVVKARLGDLAAAKIVLGYVIGKPTAPVDPDRLDLDEWQITRARPETEEVRSVIQTGCMPDLANGMVRGMDIVTLEEGRREAEKLGWNRPPSPAGKSARAKGRRGKAQRGNGKRPQRDASELSILGNGHGDLTDRLLDERIRKSRPTGNRHNGDGNGHNGDGNGHNGDGNGHNGDGNGHNGDGNGHNGDGHAGDRPNGDGSPRA